MGPVSLDIISLKLPVCVDKNFTDIVAMKSPEEYYAAETKQQRALGKTTFKFAVITTDHDGSPEESGDFKYIVETFMSRIMQHKCDFVYCSGEAFHSYDEFDRPINPEDKKSVSYFLYNVIGSVIGFNANKSFVNRISFQHFVAGFDPETKVPQNHEADPS